MDSALKLAKETLPEGYRPVLSGSSQAMKESFQSMIIALLLGIFVAYMVLGAQFNSFIHPITVLLALPFSVTGAFLALRLTGISLQHVQHDRDFAPDGHRKEELDLARGLHKPMSS